MPEVLISGEKKKVACGPCIRGHRSSKCTHKDRVLIEVRKPGRPLSTCPHPVGKCNCERVVINYTVPKSSECPCPTPTPIIPAVASARIQKSRARKSNITPSNLQKAIDEDPTTLIQSVSQGIEAGPSTRSDTSSNGPSTPSSASSTPRIAPVDKHPVSQPDIQPSSHTIKTESQPPNAPSGMIAPGGYGVSQGTIDFTGDWKDLHENVQDAPTQQPQQTPASCCFTSKIHQPQRSNSNVQQNLPGPQSSCCNSQVESSYALGTNTADPFAISNVSLDQFSLLSPIINGQQTQVFVTPIPVQQRLNNGPNDHSCRCGDACACIGCATHPRNQRMIEYVRYHNELAMRMEQERSQLSMPLHDPFQHTLPSAQGNTYSFDNLNGMALANNVPQSQYSSLFNPMNTIDPTYSMAFLGGAAWALDNLSQSLPQTSWSELESAHLHNNSNHNVITPNEISGFYTPDSESQHLPENILSTLPKDSIGENQESWNHNHTEEILMSPRRTSESHTIFLDPESPEETESAASLSPSSFLPLSVTFEGCNGGTCRCGDGCICSGCLIHSGNEISSDRTEAKL